MIYYTEKHGEGRFNAMARNKTAPHYPRRIGFIMGCRDKWAAERGPEALGYFKSRKDALAAIVADLEHAQ